MAADWSGGAEAIIRVGIRIEEYVLYFKRDTKRIEAFIQALVEVHVLTPNEAKLGLESPKLIKLRAIGRHKNLLRRKNIARFLEPSYSAMYQLIVLYEQLPKGDGEQRVTQLVSIVEASVVKASSHKLTRKQLSKETRRAKQDKRAADKPAVAQVPGEMPVEPTLGDLTAAGQLFDLVVMTPSQDDIRLLGADYPDLDTLVRDLPLSEVIADAAAVVVLLPRLIDLSVMADKLPPLVGFRRLSRVLLVRQPASPDVTAAEIIVTAERGDVESTLLEDGQWLAETGPVDILAVAARLYPKAVRKLHVFAEERTEGWTSVIGDDTWIKGPGK